MRLAEKVKIERVPVGRVIVSVVYLELCFVRTSLAN
jgi:hypothetical protein